MSLSESHKIKYSIYCYKKHYKDSVFKEIIEALKDELLKNGYYVIISDIIIKDSINLIIGANEIKDSIDLVISTNEIKDRNWTKFIMDTDIIIVNLEQLSDIKWGNSTYMSILKLFKVWDYSIDNIKWLMNKGITDVGHMIIGKTLAFKNFIPTLIKDIDVLFYGSINRRRKSILNSLKQSGINVIIKSNLWGVERDTFIRRAKIVLNIHFYETAILEVLRIFPVIANNEFIISENSKFPDGNDDWVDNIVFCDYNNIVTTVKYYLEHPELIPNRIKLSKNFYETTEFLLPISSLKI